MKRPYFKFYASDWRGDPRLRSCSLAARGLWIEMVAIMHESEPYGHLVIGKNQLGIDDFKALALQSACDAKEAKKLLSELHAQGVFSIQKDGTIYSRRMVRDDEKARKDKENGSKGGNPNIVGGVNPPDNLDEEENGEESEDDQDKGEDKAHGNNQNQIPLLEIKNQNSCDGQASSPKKGNQRKEKKTTGPREAKKPPTERPRMPDGMPLTLPDDVNALKRVAVPFLATFGNCKSAEALAKYGPSYVEALAIFRSRGISVPQVWAAFADAWLANNGKPLFGDRAKKAVSFLPKNSTTSPFAPKEREHIGSVKPQ